jgi:hypothetical protein
MEIFDKFLKRIWETLSHYFDRTISSVLHIPDQFQFSSRFLHVRAVRHSLNFSRHNTVHFYHRKQYTSSLLIIESIETLPNINDDPLDLDTLNICDIHELFIQKQRGQENVDTYTSGR